MALQSLTGLWVPGYEYWGGYPTPSLSTGGTIDAATEQFAVIFQAPKAGTLAKVRWRFGTVARDAATVLRVSFQNVSLANGDPDGAVDQYRAIAAGDIVSDTVKQSGLITSDGTDGGVKRTVTRGELLACVFDYTTFVAGDSIVFQAVTLGVRQGPSLFCYPDAYAGTWAKSYSGSMLSLEYDDGTYAQMIAVFPAFAASTTVSFKSDSATNVIGLKFRFPFPFKLGGCWLGVDLDGNADIVLYDAAGSTTLASLDKDVRSQASGQTTFSLFTAEYTGVKATDYVLAVKPTTTTALSLGYIDVTAAAELDQMGGGQAFHYATASTPATYADFTPTTTRRPMIGLLVTALDDGAGGGGGFPILGGSVVR